MKEHEVVSKGGQKRKGTAEAFFVCGL